MTPADAIAFLRRKYELLVENAWSEGNERILRSYWEPIFAAIDPSGKLTEFQKLDRAMEKFFDRFVLREDRADLRSALIGDFGLCRLTPAEIKAAAIPPPDAGDVVLRPSGKTPAVKRRYQVEGVEHTTIDMTVKTMTELAQLYADYSGKEVRLPAALAGRELPLGTSESSPPFAAQALESHLQMVHVAALPKGGKVVVFQDTWSADAALADASQPRNASAGEIQRAAAAVSVDRFWGMIEAVARNGSECTAMADTLQFVLERLALDEILGFELRLQECLAASYRMDLWAVAHIINGGCSDDGFEYFRGWLIAQGRDYFEAALADPERAADRATRGGTECESVLYVAQEAYASCARKPMPCYGMTPHPPHPTGTGWEEEDLPGLFPALIKKFS